jgi:hypothetical protein
LAAQCLEVPDRLAHGRPEVLDQAAVAAIAVVVGDGEDELAVAVVLGEPVRTLAIHATGDVAVFGLEPGVPADELPGLGGAPHAQQGGGHDRAVADPGAGVAARTGLQRGTVAIDQNVGRASGSGQARRPASGSTAPSRSDHWRTAISNRPRQSRGRSLHRVRRNRAEWDGQKISSAAPLAGRVERATEA